MSTLPKILASKALEDGTVLSAIDWGPHVILLHQMLMEVNSGCSMPQEYPRHTEPNFAVQVSLHTLRTKIITREEFNEGYERHVQEKAQIAQVQAIEDRRG